MLAVGFADGIKSMGIDHPAVELAERLYDEVFLEVTTRNQPDSAYEKYAEATQPLGFEGVEALESIIGRLMDRARGDSGRREGLTFPGPSLKAP